MSDATVTVQPTDTIVDWNFSEIKILPPVPGLRAEGSIAYQICIEWSSGKRQLIERYVDPVDFIAGIGSFCQPQPKKKFLTWLLSKSYEKDLTPV